jgi:hypothetical protein
MRIEKGKSPGQKREIFPARGRKKISEAAGKRHAAPPE